MGVVRVEVLLSAAVHPTGGRVDPLLHRRVRDLFDEDADLHLWPPVAKRSVGDPTALTDESVGRADPPRGGSETSPPRTSAGAPAAYRVLDEVDDVLRRRTRREHLGDAELLELGDVVRRDRPAHREQHVVDALRAQQLDDPRHERHVRAGQDRQADRVGVLLDHGLDDLLRRLVQAGVDDLHAGVAQGAGDDLGAAVVAVEAGLGHDDADLLGGARRGHRRRARPFYAAAADDGGAPEAPRSRRATGRAQVTWSVNFMFGAWIWHRIVYVPARVNVLLFL